MAEKWVRVLRHVAHAPVRLVCFPHSGGSASFYRPWLAHLSDVELLAVQYPGRGDRLAEPPVDDVGRMARAVAAELGPPDPPTVLFGHSLGALVAYETALARRDAGAPVSYLFVSGCRAPTEPGGATHTRDDDALWAEVASVGGLAPEVVADRELRELLLPALRADIRAGETYRQRPRPGVLDCPVRCYHGRDDPLVGPPSLRPWSRVTTGPCTLRELPGGHFPAPQQWALLVADLVDAVRVGEGSGLR